MTPQNQQGSNPAEGAPAGRERTGEPRPTPAEERGERLDTGKTIARGGKQADHVPGAEPPEPSRDQPPPQNARERPDRG